MEIIIRHDSQQESFRNPCGAVVCGTTVRLRLYVETPQPVALCQLRVWEGNGGEKLLTMNREKSDTAAGHSYVVDYQAPGEPMLVWYYFRVVTKERVFYYGNNRERLGGAGSLAEHEPPGYQITVYSPNPIPRWYGHGVMYQIFVDRFYRQPAGSADMMASSCGKKKGLLHLDWYDTPFYIRDEQGRIERWPFFGGNLAGVMAKLDYLQELGVSIIYFNPIFEASSNHKYDTGDYLTIDPMFGDETVFRQLVAAAAQRGISIILDGVFSHTGADSIYFNKEGHYPTVGAFQSPDSPYYSWYRFKEYPHEYDCWWGVDALPNVNEMEPSYREFIYGGPDAVARHWLKAGAKGWRLDVADELPGQFIKELRGALKETDPDSVLIGEVWEDASNKISYGEQREYLLGDELDATMNYPWRSIWLDFILDRTTAATAHRRQLSLYENYPRDSFYAAMNLIGSHDRIRILTLLGEAPSADTLNEAEKEAYRLTPAARDLAVQRLKLLVLLQMTFPGVPCIYYGDEAGLEGYADPHNRGTFPWGREDEELQTWHWRMVRLRREYDLLVTGDFCPFYEGEDVYGFCRRQGGEAIWVLINRHRLETKTVDWQRLSDDGCGTGSLVLDLLEGRVLAPERGGQLSIPPLGARLIYCKPHRPEKIPGDLSRAAGILLHLTSLPSPWGVGGLGREAYEFVDFLKAGGQRLWQILPLNPLGPGYSPYQSPSAFAGNPLLLDPEQLVAAGLLSAEQLAKAKGEWGTQPSAKQVDFAGSFAVKEGLLRAAFHNFRRLGGAHTAAYAVFQAQNAFWLADYCLFMALKGELGSKPWYQWETGLARREAGVLDRYRQALREEIAYHGFVQYIFFTQWQALKRYAGEQGIAIIGDLPIYVAPDSADTWAHPWLFCLDEKGKPQKIAGVPPDYFSATGQLWGNPLYDWQAMAQDDYAWWVRRIAHGLQAVDYLRLDHFRGFEAYWEIPAGAEAAAAGRWLKGPGQRLFARLAKELGRLPFIAEDLGHITPEVDNLKNAFLLPGMKVFQFSHQEMWDSQAVNTVYYTGTHDNDTLVGWCQRQEQTAAREDTVAPAVNPRRIIEKLYASPARWVILPLQDVLELGPEGRMNVPGTPEGNWGWRFQREDLTEERAARLRAWAAAGERYTPPEERAPTGRIMPIGG